MWHNNELQVVIKFYRILLNGQVSWHIGHCLYVRTNAVGLIEIGCGWIKWKHFPRYRPFVWRIHRSPVNSQHKGQLRGALMLSLNCAWINDWVNNREAGDLRRHCTHYDVTVMLTLCALGSVSICNKTSYCKILQGLEAVRFVFESVRSLRNLTGTSAAVLPVSLFNFNWFKFSISLLRDFTRSYDNTAYCILKRGPWHYRNGRNHSGHDRP